MKLLLPLLALYSTFSLPGSAYVAPELSFSAQSLKGLNAAKNAVAQQCYLDFVKVADLGKFLGTIAYLSSDAQTGLQFVVFIPAAALPLKEGSRWKIGSNQELSYENGILQSADGSFTLEVDARLTQARFAFSQSPDGSFLRCTF